MQNQKEPVRLSERSSAIAGNEAKKGLKPISAADPDKKLKGSKQQLKSLQKAK